MTDANAETIFVNISTSDGPQRVTLQTAVDSMIGLCLDLRSANEQLASLIERMQKSFDAVTKQLHSTTVQAKALMGPQPKGVN